jgi:carboxylate-amine ligase
MPQPSRLHLFQAYGIELEYMIVDQETLAVKPLADELLKEVLGSYGSEYENGPVTWSNELVLHVIELKCTQPTANLHALEQGFADNVRRINGLLAKWNARLLPTAAHPLMNPLTETRLWPHDNNEVYEAYNRIFDCKGHGWSNVQSTHINLPFYDDEEFAKLHAAVRLVLPLIPALCASSPVIEGKATGAWDTRLKYYKNNQARIPSITGRVIPEAVFSKRNYLNSVYVKIKNDIAPFDSAQVLNPIWVNSRGAIPRFDRGSIEIRLMDVQECPAADMAIVELIIEVIQELVRGGFADFQSQTAARTDLLAQVLDLTTEKGEHALIRDESYLALWGISEKEIPAGKLWSFLLDKLIYRGNEALSRWKPELDVLFREGSLSSRILKATQTNPSLSHVYRQLAECLAQNRLFIP